MALVAVGSPPTTLCPISLGDNLSETAGQKNLRDAPVVVKLTTFLVTFFAVGQHSLRCFFERHAELNSKNRPLGTVFTCFKIKRGLLNLFVAPALCFKKVCGSTVILAGGELRFRRTTKSSEKRFRRRC